MNIARSSMLAEREFLFLGKVGLLKEPVDWRNEAQEKLWLYNLHYFEDLVATDADQRLSWHVALVNDWIHDNPAPVGIGWEPYPQSLRIVNWIKWFLNGQIPESHWLQSLGQQAHVLCQDLEYHLLGNHLFANAKALIFAGLYCDGEQAEKWLITGLEIIDAEIGEQILADGGNFELTTMYHNIMLQDMLDLINIGQAYSHPLVSTRMPSWRKITSAMLGWMDVMVHADDEISFFNDAAIDVAPTPERLRSYARNLNIKSEFRGKKINSNSLTACYLEQSGYIRVDSTSCMALLDCARIGPDYLPAHAHADNLSFEMSLFGRRLFVNSGTSCYGLSDERHRQRGTAAHNTVVINGVNSSEVWGGFRVARRAYPSHPHIEKNNGMNISCSHDGYRRMGGRVIHKRSWNFQVGHLDIVDQIDGVFNEAEAYLHIHPEVKIESDIENLCCILTPVPGESVRVSFSNVSCVELKRSTWHPEFGKSIENYYLVVRFSSDSLTTTIEW